MLIKNDYKPRMVSREVKQVKPVTTNGRITLVLSSIALAFAMLVGRGVYLQTEKHDFLKEQGDQRFVRTVPLTASRGTITDRTGAPLAISAPADSLYAVPSAMSSMPSDAQIAQLTELIDVPASVIKDRLSRNKYFVYLKRQLSLETAEKVAALNIKGLAFQQETKRHYPMGKIFSHIIGFTNIDGKGQEGLELSNEKILHGIDGAKVVLRDNKGNIVDSLDSPRNHLPQNGVDMVLSLDQRIQSIAYESLQKAMAHHQADAGSVVVLDGKTGEILALVNSPGYDSNNPGAFDSDARRNRALTDMIEPGSAMKPFAIAKGLDSGKIRASSGFNTMPYNIGPARVRDTHNYPYLDVRGIIQKSSNVGTSKISAMFTPEEMYNLYTSVGFGRRMNSGFPGETPGVVRDWHKWRPIEQATMSFGYGIQMSLLQLARAYTIFTNDGVLLPISFQKLTAHPEGEQIIKPETARTVRHMMTAVTQPGGTGLQGAIEGYDVAAKTGTARMLVNGQYSATKHMATFIGFAPADNPRVIVAVNIQNPTVNGYFGGSVSGPVFREVMANTLNVLGIAPTKPVQDRSQLATR